MMEHGMQTNVKQNCNIFTSYIIFDLTVHRIFFHLPFLKVGLLLVIAATCNTVQLLDNLRSVQRSFFHCAERSSLLTRLDAHQLSLTSLGGAAGFLVHQQSNHCDTN